MSPSSGLADEDGPVSSIEEALRIKGPLRVRPNGIVKHAHVVLRKVGEEEYVDEHGRKKIRGVFSLFAHKNFSVKTGKELFLYLHPVDGKLDDRVVAFEADIDRDEAISEDRTSILEPARTDETVVHSEPVLPPRMRKQWAGKTSALLSHSATVEIGGAESAESVIGVQVELKSSPANATLETAPIDIESKSDNLPANIEAMKEPTGVETESDEPTIRVVPAIGSIHHQKGEYGLLTVTNRSTSPCLSTHLQMDSVNVESALHDGNANYLESCPEIQQDSLSSMDTDSSSITPSSRLGLVNSGSKSAQVELEILGGLDRNANIHRSISVDVSVGVPVGQLTSSTTLVEEPLMHETIHSLSDSNSHLSSNSLPATLSSPLNTLRLANNIPEVTKLSSNGSATPGSTKPANPVLHKVSSSNGDIQATKKGSFSSESQQFICQPTTSVRITQPTPTFVPATIMNSDRDSRKRHSSEDITESSYANSTPPTKKSKSVARTDPDTSSAALSSSLNIEGVPLRRDIIKHTGPPDMSSKHRDGSSHRSLPFSSAEDATVPGYESPTQTTYDHRNASRWTTRAEREHLDSVQDRMGASSHPYGSNLPSAYDSTPTPLATQQVSRSARVPSKQEPGIPFVRTAQIKLDKEKGIRKIVFDAYGKMFAVICRDYTVRIWDNKSCSEVAILAHSSMVVSVVWLDTETALASLGANGTVSKWKFSGKNKWEWSKLVGSDDTDPSCLAYKKNLLAVANPKTGISIWINNKGIWQALGRKLDNKDISTMEFIRDGTALLCGSLDGTVFCCTVPQLTVRSVTYFDTKVFQLDVDPTDRFAVVAQANGRSTLIEIGQNLITDDAIRVVRDFVLRDVEEYKGRINHAYGAMFACKGNIIIYGTIGDTVLMWDRRRGKVISELDHGDSAFVQALACFEGNATQKRCIITGARSGKLIWWSLPDDL